MICERLPLLTKANCTDMYGMIRSMSNSGINATPKIGAQCDLILDRALLLFAHKNDYTTPDGVVVPW